ncbi:MAG: BolA family protein [Acidobacteriota bacterium]
MITAADITQRILDALPGARVQVSDLTGGGDHYRVTVVAAQFENQPAVARHRMIYAPLQDVLGGDLHALSLETRTPEEWETAQKETDGARRGSLPRL